jgi:hypothetical protein
MMADVPIERRKFSRKRMRLSCHLQLGSGLLVHGNTHDMSQEGAMVEAQPLPGHQQDMAPKSGDLGLLILQFNKQGAPGSMKIRCRVMHTQANRIGLHLLVSKLSELDRQNLDMILAAESANI